MSAALQDILHLMRLNSVIYFHEEFPAPWGMQIDRGPFAQFHLIVSGSCWVETDGFEGALRLTEGDIALFPSGASHTLAEPIGSPMLQGREVVLAVNGHKKPFNGSNPGTTVICGHFSFDDAVRQTIVPLLPSIVLVQKAELEQKNWLGSVAKLIIEETEREASSVAAERLAEALLVGVLRYASNKQEQAGLLRALGDVITGNALNLMHEHLEQRWTIDSLAREIGSSRTVLATRFKDKMGISLMKYLTDVRMTHAMQMLNMGQESTLDIAEKVGYLSEAAFIRAFKRTFGVTPGKQKRLYVDR